LILRHRTAPVSPLRQLASRALAYLPVLVLLVACSSGTTPTTAVPPTAGASTTTAAGTPTSDVHFPDIVRVMATRNADGSFDR